MITDLCDAFSTRLYDYCHMLRGGSGPAMDAVAGTFAAALAHAERLHEAERLRAWLYAIARNISTRTSAEPSAIAGEDAPTLPPGDESRLAWIAMQALDDLPPRDREVLRLSLVHGLETQEIAAILDVALEEAAALVSRVRAEFEDGVTAGLVARHGRDACPVLAGLTDDSAAAPAALRHRVARHIAACPACAGTRVRVPAPASAASLLPVNVPPQSLHERAVATAARAVPEAGAERTAEWARGARLRLGLAIAATLVILAAPLLLWTGGRDAGGLIGQPGIRGNGHGLGLLPGPGSPGPSPSATPATPATPTPAPRTTAPSDTPRPGGPAAPPTSRSPSGPSSTRPSGPGTPTRAPGDSIEEEHPADGTLAVSPSTITLSPDETSEAVQVTATGGDVSWSGTGASYLSPKKAGGILKSGKSTSLTITLDRASAPESGSSSYTVSDRGGSSTTIAVTW